jgi:hypothetical protein
VEFTVPIRFLLFAGYRCGGFVAPCGNQTLAR